MKGASRGDARPDLFDQDGRWMPPTSYREHLESTAALARSLVELLEDEPSMFVPVDRVTFLARRLATLTSHTVVVLPPEVI